MTDIAELYVDAFNAEGDDARRTAIGDLWAADAQVYLSKSEFLGLEQIEQRVRSAHEQFVRDGGYEFHALREAVVHHGAAFVEWEMTPRGGGEQAGSGRQFLLLDDEGKIRLDFTF